MQSRLEQSRIESFTTACSVLRPYFVHLLPLCSSREWYQFSVEYDRIVSTILNNPSILPLSAMSCLTILQNLFPFLSLSQIMREIFDYHLRDNQPAYSRLCSLNRGCRIEQEPRLIAEEIGHQIDITPYDIRLPDELQSTVRLLRLLCHTLTIGHSLTQYPPCRYNLWDFIFDSVRSDQRFDQVIERALERERRLQLETFGEDGIIALEESLTNARDVLYMGYWFEEEFSLYSCGYSCYTQTVQESCGDGEEEDDEAYDERERLLTIERAYRLRNAANALMTSIIQFIN